MILLFNELKIYSFLDKFSPKIFFISSKIDSSTIIVEILSSLLFFCSKIFSLILFFEKESSPKRKFLAFLLE